MGEAALGGPYCYLPSSDKTLGIVRNVTALEHTPSRQS